MLSGDIGEGIVPGSGKHIVWDAGTDWDGEYSDLMRVMVYAVDSQGCPGLEWGDEVPPGGFLLGQDGGAEGSDPSRHVNIPWSYWLSKYEITVQQYCDFLNTAFAARRVALKDFSAVYSIRDATYTNFSGSYLLCNVGDSRKIRWNVSNFEVISNYHRYPADVTWFGAMAFAQFYGYDLPDAWETAHGTSPTTPDAHLDPDSDGRTNLQEYNAGTNPLAPDDWTLSSAPSPVFRIDTRLRHSGKIPVTDIPFAVYRVSNLFRCDTGGRPPAATDTDGDGIPDWWAIRYANAPTALDPASDEDGDGYTALEEYIALTDPTDPDSFLCVTLEPLPSTEIPAGAAIRAAMTGQAVTWPSAAGRTYTLQAITNLMQSGSSTDIATLEGTGGILAVPVPDTIGIPLRFFRLTVTLSPTAPTP